MESSPALRVGSAPTERTAAPAALLLSAEPHLQKLFESAACGIGFLDSELKLGICNDALAAILGAPRKELVGQPAALLFPALQPSLKSMLETLGQAREPEPRTLQCELGQAGARRRFVELVIRAVSFEKRVVGFALTAHDVSALVEARQAAEREQERLKAAAGALQERLHREQVLLLSGRDRFLALLGHELRNPLTPILTWTQLLKQDAGLSARLSHAIAVIERNALHQKSLVDDLLDLACLHSGEMKFERTALSLETTLAEVARQYQVKAHDAGVALQFKSDARASSVLGDRQRLAQIFRNLVDNAIKFTPPGGSVSLHLANEGTWVRVDISDTGIGIPKAFMQELFETFTQAHELQSRFRRGLGVGLALVKHLVERHAGRVEARSEGEHKGATFTVHLPLFLASSGVGNGGRGHAAVKPKVAVIEDNDDTREVLRTLLESWGLEVGEACDGRAGLQLVGAMRPDLVLCDLTMPVLDGWSVARELRGGCQTRDVPLIALSGHGTPRDITRSKDCGFQDHLVKPFEAQDLYRMISRYLILPADLSGPQSRQSPS